jgi:hypothetical protein
MLPFSHTQFSFVLAPFALAGAAVAERREPPVRAEIRSTGGMPS